MGNIEFAYPGYFYLLGLLVPYIAYYIWKQKDISATVQISATEGLEKYARPFKHYLRHILYGLRILALILIIVALARPQSKNTWQDITSEGIDIVMAIDVSTSMLAEDFSPNRLEASKNMAAEFINGRPNDRIGLVVFSGESFTQCPLTTDHAVLLNLFKDVKSGLIEDGTAIGLGIANSINRLKESKSKSKVIILLTDGVNNSGELAPVTAAEIAKTYGIRVYTIGVGTMGKARYPYQTPFGVQYDYIDVEIDEDVLGQIADMTGGQYFRATDNSKLREIYSEIDQMEKSKIEVKEYSKKKEEFYLFALAAAGAFILELLLNIFVMRKIP